MATVHPMGKRGKSPIGSKRARVERLRERLQTERDPKVRAAIEARLAAFKRRF